LVEVNISCPNVEDCGQVIACDPRAASDVVDAVRRNTAPGIPVFAKLSPDVTDIAAIARACVDAGADGLSVINTLLGMVIDTGTLRPVLGGVTGGLSGPAIRPVAVRCVWQVHAALPDVPILGMGGIRTGLDALEFVLAGASAVSVGTTVFGDPTAPVRVLAELHSALQERGFERFGDAVGLGRAIEYVTALGLPQVAAHEQALLAHGTAALAAIPGLRLVGTSLHKAGVLSFVLEGTRVQDVGRFLDQEGIAVRAGHHCAQPALRHFGLDATVRPSIGLYNTYDDIDVLADAVRRAAGALRR